MTRAAIIAIIGLQLLHGVVATWHARRTDQRQEQLYAEWQRIADNLGHVMHNTNPNHPHTCFEIRNGDKRPTPGCYACQHLCEGSQP